MLSEDPIGQDPIQFRMTYDVWTIVPEGENNTEPEEAGFILNDATVVPIRADRRFGDESLGTNSDEIHTMDLVQFVAFMQSHSNGVEPIQSSSYPARVNDFFTAVNVQIREHGIAGPLSYYGGRHDVIMVGYSFHPLAPLKRPQLKLILERL